MHFIAQLLPRAINPHSSSSQSWASSSFSMSESSDAVSSPPSHSTYFPFFQIPISNFSAIFQLNSGSGSLGSGRPGWVVGSGSCSPSGLLPLAWSVGFRFFFSASASFPLLASAPLLASSPCFQNSKIEFTIFPPWKFTICKWILIASGFFNELRNQLN